MTTPPTNQKALQQRIEWLWKHINQASKEVDYSELTNDAELSRDNLLAYLALREQYSSDLRYALEDRGLAALEQSYTHILYTLEKILDYFHSNSHSPPNLTFPAPVHSRNILKKRAEQLLGKKLPSIMITLDAKLLNDSFQMEGLLLNGMDIARINCAHDHQEIWEKLIESLRQAEKKLQNEGKYQNKICKIYMDLAGPKVRIGKLTSVQIFVMKGDSLRLYLDTEKQAHPVTAEGPAAVPVTLVKAFRNVRIKDRIFIDDGKIQGTVQKVTKEYIDVEILTPTAKRIRIKEGKGLNLPDSLLSLNVPALTEKDIVDLAFVTKHADIVGISFVHSPLDLIKLRSELEKHTAVDIGVVAKIETKDAVHHLARILLEGLHFKKFGIMLARGDLAVEIGTENLSFVQDEILTICSAAHTPVIWATGVLEKLTKKGIPARSEITDAAYGKRAECIMLNKGTYVMDALNMLVKVLGAGESYHPRKEGNSTNLTAQFGVFHRPKT